MSTTLLPPAAFLSDAAEQKLLSPSKFAPSSPRKAVRIARRRSQSPSSGSDDTQAVPVRKASKSPSLRYKENVCGNRDVNVEIERLRKENYRLLEENLKKTYECALPKAQFTKALQAVDCNTQKHVDSLISKQAEEINDLKSQLLDMKREYDSVLSEMRRDVTDREDEHRRDLSLLRVQHEQQLRVADDQLQSEKAAWKRREEEFEGQRRALNDSVFAARESLDKCNCERESLSQLVTSLQSQLGEMQGSSDEKDRLVQQLRTQLSTYQQRDGEKERWPQERRQLENRLSASSSECQTLRSENEMLLVRVSSINSILTAQQDSLRSSGVDSCEQDKLHSLLNSWRYRVYQLLVQQKSQELVDRKEAADNRQQVETLQSQVLSIRSRVRELASTVTERDGQISILSQHKQKLESTLAELHEEITEYREREEKERQLCGDAIQAVRQLYIQYESQVNKLERIEERVKQQDSRVIGACKQLRHCHAAAGERFRDLSGRLSLKVGECEELSSQLYEKVGDCEELTQKLGNSDLVKRDFQKKYEELQHSLLTQAHLAEEREETIAGLRDEINKLTNHIDLERKGVELEIEGQYKDRIAQYEYDISALKKDLAKTVVALRQAERRQANDGTSHTRELDNVTSHTSNRIQSLQSELAGVQVERNLLHSNLAALGSARHRALPRVSRSLGTSPQTSPYKSVTADHSLTTRLSSTSADKVSILGSVTQLAASVLDSESDTDDDVSEGGRSTSSLSSTRQP